MSWARFRATVVSLAALVILGILFYLLTGGTLFSQKAALYLYVSDATGLETGSPVRVDGIDVGKVQAVELSGSNTPNRVVRVVLTIDRDRLASIPEDSDAQLSSDSLIGDKFVDVTSGKSAVPIRAGGEILFKDKTDFMKTVDLEGFEKQLRVIDATLTDIEQRKSLVGDFILGDDMYRNLCKRIAELEAGAKAAADTTTSVGQALYSDALYRKYSDSLVELDRDLARLQSGQGSVGELLRGSAQYQQLRTEIQSLQKTIRDVHSSDFVQSDAQYKNWNQMVTSLTQRVDEINASPLFRTSELYDNITGMAKEIQKTTLDFRTDPRKFLRLKLF